MSELKVTATHLRRAAVVYVRQSTLARSTATGSPPPASTTWSTRAERLGWPRSAVRVIDDDLGVCGAARPAASGFAELAALVGLGQVGIVLSLECSRLARYNADWYRLLDLAGMTDTLLADTDGVYHPGLFNDRLMLGMKGTMSEAELHILRARLDGGIRNKAARGELRRGLPVGLVWGEADGQIRWHPDEAVTGVIPTIFDRFAVCGSVRGMWLWLREQGLRFPLQPAAYLRGQEITWVEPTYHAVHHVLTHPAYAGAYVFGKTRQQRHVDEDGMLRTSRRKLPQGDWEVLIPEHHEGSSTGTPTRPTRPASTPTPARAHQPGTGAVREGCALLQGLAICGTCGRKLAVYYDGPAQVHPRLLLHRHRAAGRGPRHPAPARRRRRDRRRRHRRVPGRAGPAGLQACLAAAQQLEDGQDTALAQWRREVEQARYQAGKAERRYLAVDPDNRLVARGLEADWNTALRTARRRRAELARRETARPKTLTPHEKQAILALGDDLAGVWSAATTTDKDRKSCCAPCSTRSASACTATTTRAARTCVLRWKGGAITELSVPLKRKPPQRLRTDEDTIDLLRRLAAHYPDATIAGILNRQHRRTARGLSFTASRVQSLRHHWKIPCHQPGNAPTEGEPLTVADAAHELGLAPSTLHRWLNDGFIAGEQITPGAPWRIRLTDDIRALFVDDAPDGWLAMLEATLAYGVSRQTLMQRVKRGELHAVHVRTGRRKGLRIQPPTPQDSLF